MSQKPVIYIGADHNGYELKERLKAYLTEGGYQVVDKGDRQYDKHDDFPVYAAHVATEVLAHPNSIGLLICGSGQGMCMAANRYNGIRASLVWNEEEAYDARHDDDSNVLCLPSRQLDFDQAREIVDVWLNTEFSGAARFKRRNNLLDTLH